MRGSVSRLVCLTLYVWDLIVCGRAFALTGSIVRKCTHFFLAAWRRLNSTNGKTNRLLRLTEVRVWVETKLFWMWALRNAISCHSTALLSERRSLCLKAFTSTCKKLIWNAVWESEFSRKTLAAESSGSSVCPSPPPRQWFPCVRTTCHALSHTCDEDHI